MTTRRTSSHRNALWSLATALALCSAASAAPYEAPASVFDNPSANFFSQAGNPQPLPALPAQVQAAEGELTLWADYTSAEKSSVPLYLVNRTAADVVLGTQDSDLGIKLEFKKADGVWTRAQAHLSSFCGNSYYPVTLPAGHFFMLRGYRAAGGEPHLVRYAFHGGLKLVSNTGEGLVSPGDISAVRRDYLAMEQIPYPLYSAIDSYIKGRRDPGTLAECTAILHMLPLLEREEILMDKAAALRKTLAAEPFTAERQEAIQAIDQVLAHQWTSGPPTSASPTQLCMQRILDAPGAAQQIKQLPEHIAWNILADAARRIKTSNVNELSAWKAVLARAEQLLREPNTPSAVRSGARSLLGIGRVVEPLVPDVTVTAWLKSPCQELQDSGAQALVRRGQKPQLVQLSWGLSPEAQMAALRALAQAHLLRPSRDGAVPPSPSDEEKRYWTHCFRTQTLESIRAGAANASAMGDAVRHPLRDLLIQEAIRGGSAEKAFPLDKRQAVMLPYAIWILEEFHNAEDDSLLRDLSKHQGVAEQQDLYAAESTGPVRPVVAEAAKAVLQRRAESSKAAPR